MQLSYKSLIKNAFCLCRSRNHIQVSLNPADTDDTAGMPEPHETEYVP